MECWIVDVGDYEDIKKIIHGYTPKGVLLTHIHYDHIYGLNKLLIDYPYTPIYTNSIGLKYLSSPSDNLSLYHDDVFKISDQALIVVLSDYSRIEMGNLFITAINSPGHDKSCMCYISDKWIFTGDAYIPGKPIFDKLQNSDKNDARVSLAKIISLSIGKCIYPGH